VNGRVGVVHGRVAVGKNSCTTPIKQLIELDRVWSSLVGEFGRSGRSS